MLNQMAWKRVGLYAAFAAAGIACAQNQTGGNPDPDTPPPDPAACSPAAMENLAPRSPHPRWDPGHPIIGR